MGWMTVFRTDNHVMKFARYGRDATKWRDGARQYTTVNGDTLALSAGLEGICAGMSAQWLRNMGRKGELDSAPKELLSGVAHMAAELEARRGGDFNLVVLESCGLSVIAAHRLTPANAFALMRAMQGSYYVSTGNHAMAVVHRGRRYFFFDPNGGVYATDSGADFAGAAARLVSLNAGQRNYSENWAIIRVKGD